MRRIVVLDSGPLGVGCRSPSSPMTLAFRAWLSGREHAGACVYVPAIAEYEMRRKLLHIDAKASLRRLDALIVDLNYSDITPAVMRLAAELWADARRRGRPTSGPRALDADSILAAQALLLGATEDVVTVATDNVGHLSQFLDARPWTTIT